MRVCCVLQVYNVLVTNACLLCITGVKFMYNNIARFSTKLSLDFFLVIVLYMYIQQQRGFKQQRDLFMSDEQIANLKFNYF